MPKAIRTLPSAEYLHQCFEYDAEAGHLRWRERPREHFQTLRSFMTWNSQFSGHIAGFQRQKDGRMLVGLNFRAWHIGRVIYKMHYGVDPEWIDHKDRNPQNNQIDNLRSATLRENNRNKLRAVGASGLTGVVRHGKSRFRAIIWDSGKPIRLGMFDTAEEAHTAYREAANRIFGEFSPFRD